MVSARARGAGGRVSRSTTGTLTDSHAYSQPGTPYQGTITLTDDSGTAITENFNVTVLDADFALTDFRPSADGTALDVTYTVTGSSSSAPFTIGIYSSTDGALPDSLLGSYAVGATDQTQPAVGTHEVPIPPPTTDLPANYSLLAVADSDLTPDDNTAAFDGGIFQATAAGQTTVYVFAAGAADTVTIHSGWIQFDQQSYPLGSGVAAIQVRTAAPATR